MDPGGLNAKQLARALANRSAARLLDKDFVMAYADATAALLVSGHSHAKASHRASEALAKLAVKRHVLVDTDLAEQLKKGERGTASVHRGDFEAAFNKANKSYGQALRKGDACALADALAGYSNIVKALRGPFSLCTGALLASRADELVELGDNLESAAQIAVAAAVVLPSEKTFDVVSKTRQAVLDKDTRK